MTTITITDEAGSSGTVTVDKDLAAETISGWYPEPTTEIVEALGRLQAALDRGEYTGDLETFLAIRIDRQS